jgi:thioredoxin-related protein
LQAALERFKAQGFRIVTINMMTSQDKGAVKIMSQYSFTALKNHGEGWSWGQKTYGVQGTPTSFLLDPQGKIIFNVPGFVTIPSEQESENEVASLLKWTENPEYARSIEKSSVATAVAKPGHTR